MTDAAVTTPVPSESRDLSTAAKLFGVIFSPGEAFAAIARKPDFIAPLVTLIAASVAVTETMLARIGASQIVRNAIEQSGRAQSMTPEQVDQAVAQGAKAFEIFGRVGEFLGVPILLLIVAGLALLIVNAIYGGEIKFKTAFSITAYADIPAVLASLMGLVMIFFGDTTHFNPQGFLPTSPGFFIDPQQVSKPLLALASALDIFAVWFMALLGIGLSAATGRKVKPLPIFLGFFGAWVLITIARVGLAML